MKGHPILGVITGFLFGLFLGITLFLYGVIPLSSDWLWILPLLGILLGLIMAAWAPFGKSAAPIPAPPVPNAPPATIPPATDAPVPPAGEAPDDANDTGTESTTD
jgi:hypothetical protein